jgi:hypothetical protein
MGGAYFSPLRIKYLGIIDHEMSDIQWYNERDFVACD